MDSYHSFLPKLGHTRCYWALLSADLQFIYLDPVLTYHLDAQAEPLVGKSLLSFVHPDEQASAKADLRSVLESRTLHGSVTRVRFSRLSKVRRQLGYQGPPTPWSDAEKIAVDANYMAVDIVINWAAEGLVLCFIHATVDLDPQSDNDELHKSHWTNWCGTPLMPADHIQLLFRRLLICVPQSPSGSHTRIFQILANQPGRQLLLSWPPDQGNGPTGREFATLVENAEMGSGTQKGNDAKTSCTRRYRATQLMSPSFGEVESIFIPHGTVIFACHKVESSVRSTPTTPVNMQHHLTYNTNNGSGYPPPGPPYYDSPSSYPPLVPPYNQGYLSHQSLPPPPPPPPSHAYPPSRWSPVQQQNYPPPPPPPVQQWSTPSPTHPVSPIQPTPASMSMDNSHLRSASYSSGPGPSWQPSPGSYEVYRTASPTYGSYSGPSRASAVASNANRGILPATSALLSTNTVVQDIVPPPKRRVSPGTARVGDQHNIQATGSGSGRGSGNRPLGVQQCSSCGATTSPEWRKGPSGKKELCNACGLRYARSRAKKDGGAPTQTHNRKKKTDKADDRHHVVGGSRGGGGGVEVKREIRQKDRVGAGVAMTPPLATIAAAGGSPGYASTIMRRSFGSGSEYGASGTSPAGSISGSEGGSHGHAHYVTLAAGGGGASSGANRGGSVLTPSPSPPASVSVTSTSGSLALPLPVSSPNTSTVTATRPQTDTTSHDIGFVHYNPASHERMIPPLTVHPHSPHTTQPPHPHSPHSALSPGGHYLHSAYAARPSPLSQVGNIVTGPAAGPLTPLSGLRSAKEEEPGAGNAMQLPPLAYMDRVAGSNQINDHGHGPLGTGVKPEYVGEGLGHNNGNGMQGSSGGGSGGGGGPGGAFGREPLTPLSAESPVGPGVAGASHGGNGRSGGRSILSGQ